MEYSEVWWLPSLLVDKNGSLTSELKPKQVRINWIVKGVRQIANSLYYIFNGVSPNKFHKIATWKYIKVAWDILAIPHEGTSTMKSKLQMLNYKVWKHKDEDDETFSYFYTKPNDIVNSCFNLG